MSFDSKLFKINKKAIKILKKSPNSLLEFLTGISKLEGVLLASKTQNPTPNPTPRESLTVSDNFNSNFISSTQAQRGAQARVSQRVSDTRDTQNTLIANQKSQANLLNKYVFNKFFICCKESRIESPTSFYGCFYIGPFDESLSQTLAHNIRRTLLSQLSGLAITAVEIDGVLHKFSNLPGIKENVLDIICNLQNLVLKENIKPQFALALKNNNAITLQKLEFTGYLRVRGPGIVTAADILLPSGLQCVNPNQYIATLAEDGCLNIKFYISAGQGQNYIKQKQKNTDLDDLKQQFLINNFTKNTLDNLENNVFQDLPIGVNQDISSAESNETNNMSTYVNGNVNKNKIYLDSVFMPVTKVNTFVQQNDKCTDDYLENNLQFKYLPEELKQSINNNTVLAKALQQSSKDLALQASNNDNYLNQTKENKENQENQENKENQENQEPILINKTKKPASFRNLAGSPKKQSTNFDAVFKTSKFNIHSKDASYLHSSQEQKVQTFFQCLPTLENSDAISNNGNLKASSLFDMSTDQIQQAVVLTEKNKVGETSLNFKKQSHIVVEIWTNGSIHPREALKNCLQFLSNTFVSLENVKMLGAMFKSDVTYTKLLKNYKY